MDDIEKIRSSFFLEAEEIIENLEALLLDLENNPNDKEILNAVFRNMHTLKGSSAICELNSLSSISHILEDLLDYIRSENISPSIEIMDTLFEGLDLVKAVFSMTREGSAIDESIYKAIDGKVKQILPEKKETPVVEESKPSESRIDDAFIQSIPDAKKESVASHVDDGNRLYQIVMMLEENCMSQGIDPLLQVKSLAYDGEVLYVQSDTDNVPLLGDLDPVCLYLRNIKLLYSSSLGFDEVDEIFEFARETGSIEVHQLLPAELQTYFGVEYDDFWLEQPETTEDKEEEASTDILDPTIFFGETKKILSHLSDNLKKIQSDGAIDDDVNSIFRSFHTICGNSRMFGFHEIASIAGFSETILDKIRNGTSEMTPQVAGILFDAASEIGDFVRLRQDEKLYESFSPDKEGEAVKKLGEILIEMGELNEDQLEKALKNQDKPLGEILVNEGIVQEEKVEKALQKQKSLGISTQAAVRVETDKLDNLVNMVGELVITQTLLSHNDAVKRINDHGFMKILSQMDKITREVQESVMSIRMLPIKATFQKLIRVAREVSKQEGKTVSISMDGEDTELDKTVIDEIGDPMIHIMRNAVDHGLETTEERVAAGKNEAGNVELKAYHQGGNIMIEVKDDGRGLDRKKILEKAFDRGLVKNKDELTDEQVYNLIFLPGFSTAKSITGVSGRGVGMDVVKRNVEKLRGRVDVISEKGKGSTFAIRLPLTLAVIDGMVVRVGRERYILPTISVVESLRPSKEQVITVQGRGEMVKIREELFPLIRLHRLFGMNAISENPWETMVIQVEGEGKRACLLVDELVGQQQVVIKSLGESFKKINYISGGAIMGDGKVGLILDTGGIISVST